jgi:excisionase family DNA binding protein
VFSRTISDPELAALWRVHPTTLSTWHTKGLLVSDGISGRTHWYFHNTINRLHGRGRQSTIPDVADLVQWQEQTHKPSLLTAEEVTEQSGYSYDVIARELRSGNLMGFKLPGCLWRIPVQCLAEYIRDISPDAVTKDQASKLLGITTGMVEYILNNDPLALARLQTGPQAEILISKASLLAYIEEHLAKSPEGKTLLTGQEWWMMRELYRFEPLLTQDEAQAKFNVHGRTLKRLISDGTLPCLFTAGGHGRIPLHALERWNTTRLPVGQTLLEQVLGVNKYEAWSMVENPSFCVRKHGTKKPTACPTIECVRKYVASRRITQNFTPESWLDACLEDKMRLVVIDTKTHKLTPDAQKLRAGLKNGNIRGVWLPDKQRIAVSMVDWWRIAHTQ